MKVQSTARVTHLVMAPCLAACSSNPGKQDIGMIGGAVVGGVVGASLTGGSYIGNRIAKGMD